jgi:hypothetical protein
MKNQKHNVGPLTEITCSVEEQVAIDLETMSKNSGLTKDEIVCIAIKRFRVSHTDYLGNKVEIEE